MSVSLTRLLLGRTVANQEADGLKIGVWAGIPAMGLDGLGSAAYGPEAALTILAGAGATGLGWVKPITWIVVLLLAVLYFSYRQTIAAYPNNGGSYTVAKANLGVNAGLLAAAALMVDYILNVAVGISAGVGALTSAVPSLHAYTLPLCLGILSLITLVNLRGTRESGLVLALPTYVFIASVGGILAWGVAATWSGGPPQPVIAPPPVPAGAEAAGLWLVLRAFASGCTAMTGVEAVSNGVGAFREPRVANAHGTLTAIVVVLALLLLGVAQLAQSYGIMAMDQTQDGYQSVLSQLVSAVYGRGWLYNVTIGSVLAVLCLSANTSFVGFPRLCHLMAADGFLPRPFAMPGRRLVYSAGIGFLGVSSAALLAAFGGITDRLIPLFAVGAFLSFTMSQAGMAVHWHHVLADRRQQQRRSTLWARLAINGGGAAATAAALAIILAAKFTDGAWLTVVVIPATLLLLRAVHRFYADVDAKVLTGSARCISVHNLAPPLALVPIARWDRLARKAVEHALRISPEVTALHVTSLEGPDADSRVQQLQQDWRLFVEQPAIAAGLQPPRLVLAPSPYRSMVAPLLRAVAEAQRPHPGRNIMIVLPELVEGHWWGALMHAHRERHVRTKILRGGGPHVTVATVPWQLQPSEPGRSAAEEGT